MKKLISFFAALATILILDAIWLGWAARPFYEATIGSLMEPEILQHPSRVASGAVVYVLLSWGITHFVVVESLPRSLAKGALFGLIVYGVYDWTNFAILKGWPLSVGLVDNLWGIVVCAAGSGVACWISKPSLKESASEI